MKNLVWIVFALICRALVAQQGNLGDSLLWYGDIMLNASLGKHRMWAAMQYDRLFELQLKENAIPSLTLKGNVCKIYPPDSSFYLHTFQVVNDEEESIYYGYLVFKDGSYRKLLHKPRDLSKMRFEPIFPSNWYGALYFYFVPDQVRPGVYTLFGYCQKKNMKYKIIETLKIEKGIPVFGVEAFAKMDTAQPDKIQKRVVIPYSPSAFCNITYNSEARQIVYDHIIPVVNWKEGNIVQYLPDGSYEAFEYHNGQWQYIEKLPVKAVAEPPREYPVLDGGRKDILGNPPKKPRKK